MRDFSDTSIASILLTQPMSLMGEWKLAYISGVIERLGCQSILEIGTFAGGNAYLLAKTHPGIQVTTVDANDFESYLRDKGNMHIIDLLGKKYPSISINPESLKHIQAFYQAHSPNAVFLDRHELDVTSKRFDMVVIDGDHSVNGLLNDLEQCCSLATKAIIVDDTMHHHIRDTVKSFCEKQGWRYEFTAFLEYNGQSGNDLCIIELTQHDNETNTNKQE